ncbi:hypothetical protein [Hydrogenophaga sp.]|uniref:hypothetical protein n=1 Tax=Hydrogenophaga sp. TaxID=1904254 RepID=UPI002FC7DF63
MTNSDWLTFALVAITGFYAWATFRILRANELVVEAMREQTEALLRPYVIATTTVRTGTTLVCLEIQNTGKSPALNVRLKMDRDFYPHAENREHENIAKLPAFSQPIESFAPGARLVFLLGVGGTIFAPGVDEALCPRVFHVQAEYDYGGRTYSEDNIIDTRPMLHSSVVQHPVATEIDRLRQSLEKGVKLKQ